MSGKDIRLKCLSCGNEFSSKELERYCSNCFACTGCERYTCPFCESEIIKIPMKKWWEENDPEQK